MALILLLETATEICSVAILKDEKILAQSKASKDYSHSEKLTLLIQECVEKAAIQLTDLDAVAISKGPGSYTSLRVGTSVAKGICYALDLPLIAIDTLQALAHAAAQSVKDESALYCAMIDARRMEVYASIYDANNQTIVETQAIIVDEKSFQDYFSEGKCIVFTGNGAEKCKAVITNPLAHFKPLLCDALHLTPLVKLAYTQKNFVDTAYFVPTYGKAPNITKPKKVL